MCGIILSTLVIVGILPLGLQICYEHGELSFQGRLFFIPVRVGVEEERRSRWKRAAFSWLRGRITQPDGKIFLKNAYTTLKRLISRIRIPYLKLHIIAAGQDPANVAVGYGAAGSVLSRLRTLSSRRIGKTDLRAAVDFQRSTPEVVACVQVSLYLYQVVWAGGGFVWGVWRDHRRQRKRSMSAHDQSATW